jgi:catechol 2,3-dioxygenase-like lactoylglutathione lyase family enzyme
MKIWTLGAKVPDLEREIAFVQGLGGSLVLDDRIPLEGEEFRVPLLRFGDKYLHIAERMVYERRLDQPLADGLCHVVFQVDGLGAMREAALAAGALEIMPVSRITAGFGTREVAFLRSPGGILFELIRIIENAVPELP